MGKMKDLHIGMLEDPCVEEPEFPEFDDTAYENWFKGTPEYWVNLCSGEPVNIISPGDNRERYICSGVINNAK